MQIRIGTEPVDRFSDVEFWTSLYFSTGQRDENSLELADRHFEAVAKVEALCTNIVADKQAGRICSKMMLKRLELKRIVASAYNGSALRFVEDLLG